MILDLCSLTILHRVIVVYTSAFSCIDGQALHVAGQCAQYL